MPDSVVREITEPLMDIHSYLWDEPYKVPRVYENHGAQYNTILNFMRLNDKVKPYPAQTWRHYEKGWLRTPVHVLANVAAAGVGNDTTFTLSPQDIDANGNYPFEDFGSTILMPGSGGKEVRIEGVNVANPAAPVVTISPMDGSYDIGALTAGTTLIIYSNCYAGGSGMPVGKMSFPTERDYSMRLFEAALRIQGHMIGKEQYYRRYGKDGQALEGIYDEGLFDKMVEIDKDVALAFWKGSDVTNPTMVVSAAEAAYLGNARNVGNAIKGTKSIIDHITERGDTRVVPIGDVAFSDWQNVGIYLKSQAVNARTVDWFLGEERKMEFDQFFRSNNLQSSDFTNQMAERYYGKDFKSYTMSFDFDAVKIGSFLHMFHVVDEFDDSRTLNADGYNYSQKAVGIPRSMVTDFNPDGDDIMSNISVRYFSNKDYSRRNETFVLGGANVPIYTTELDEKGVFLRRNLGLDFLYANQGLIWNPR